MRTAHSSSPSRVRKRQPPPSTPQTPYPLSAMSLRILASQSAERPTGLLREAPAWAPFSLRCYNPPPGSGRSVPDLCLCAMSVQGNREGSPSGRQRDWSCLLGIGVSLAALLIAVWGIDFEAFVEVLSRASYLFLIPAYLLQIAGIASRAKGWKSLLGPEVPYRRAFAAINEGYLLNNILPFRLGELARAFLVGHSGIGASRALGSIVVERMIDVSIAVLSIVLTIPLFGPPAWATQVAVAVGLGLVPPIGRAP